IFMKLASLAGRVVFVGDIKQAIYGFRGCDPELVRDTLAALVARGASYEVLEHSWRSRPPLVEYVNCVFKSAFAGELEEKQIVLSPKRPDETDEPAVLKWTLKGNKAARAAQIAGAVAALVRSGFTIVDPETKRPRPARFGDIAILAARNDEVKEIATALRAAHVPMKMTLAGLLAVPEVALAGAALRRLNDPAGTVATAAIISMSAGTAPEQWLADRLRALERGDDALAWGRDAHPILAKLEALRESIGTMSPVEIVARVLNTTGLRDIVTGFSQNAIK